MGNNHGYSCETQTVGADIPKPMRQPNARIRQSFSGPTSLIHAHPHVGCGFSCVPLWECMQTSLQYNTEPKQGMVFWMGFQCKCAIGLLRLTVAFDRGGVAKRVDIESGRLQNHLDLSLTARLTHLLSAKVARCSFHVAGLRWMSLWPVHHL